jgi:hypothetical protein
LFKNPLVSFGLGKLAQQRSKMVRQNSRKPKIREMLENWPKTANIEWKRCTKTAVEAGTSTTFMALPPSLPAQRATAAASQQAKCGPAGQSSSRRRCRGHGRVVGQHLLLPAGPAVGRVPVAAEQQRLMTALLVVREAAVAVAAAKVKKRMGEKKEKAHNNNNNNNKFNKHDMALKIFLAIFWTIFFGYFFPCEGTGSAVFPFERAKVISRLSLE